MKSLKKNRELKYKKRRKKNVVISRQQNEYDTDDRVKIRNNAINFVIAFFLLLGSIPLSGSIWLIINGYLSQSWLPTKGRIIISDLVAVAPTYSESIYDGRYPREIPTFQWKVVYSYSVNNDHFTGSRLNYGGVKIDRNILRLGNEVTVYYSPTNPKKSVLQPGISKNAYNQLYFGLFCVIVSMLLLCFRKKSKAVCLSNLFHRPQKIRFRPQISEKFERRSE